MRSIREDLRISDDLDQEFATHPEAVEHWGREAADAEVAFLYARQRYKKKQAEVMMEKRRAAAISGDPKKSIKLLEQEVLLDSRVDGAFNEMVEAQRRQGYAAAAYKSILEKSSSLISMGAKERRGMGHAPSVSTSPSPFGGDSTSPPSSTHFSREDFMPRGEAPPHGR